MIKKIIESLHNAKGFTLVEAIATIAIFGIVVTPIAMVFQYALTSSIETRTNLKANQITQQYVEAIEVMEFDVLKSLIDDYGGIVDATSIAGLELAYTTDVNLPEPDSEFDVLVDLHYGEFLTDGSCDVDYNVGSAGFDSPEYILDPGIMQYKMPDYDMLILLESSDDTIVKTFTPVNPYNDGSGTPSETFPDVAGNRNLVITYENGGTPEGIKVTTQVSGGGTSDYISFDKDHKHKTFIIVCDDEVGSETVDTHITVENYSMEGISVLVFESITDKIKPVVVTGLGTVNIERSLSEIDITSNSHRIYEVEVIISKDGEELTHVTTTKLAR